MWFQSEITHRGWPFVQQRASLVQVCGRQIVNWSHIGTLFASADILCTVPPELKSGLHYMQDLFIPTGSSWQRGEGGLSEGGSSGDPGRHSSAGSHSHSLPAPQGVAFKTWQALSDPVCVARMTESECKQGSY